MSLLKPFLRKPFLRKPFLLPRSLSHSRRVFNESFQESSHGIAPRLLSAALRGELGPGEIFFLMSFFFFSCAHGRASEGIDISFPCSARASAPGCSSVSFLGHLAEKCLRQLTLARFEIPRNTLG